MASKSAGTAQSWRSSSTPPLRPAPSTQLRSAPVRPSNPRTQRSGTSHHAPRCLYVACGAYEELGRRAVTPGRGHAPPGHVFDLDFGEISGSTMPDRSGNANDGTGQMGAVGAVSVWNPP